ncbi:helix-turn-helix domain-containing protein (plasmid) [Streptomyces sp. NBC_00853]|uniref:helix-turn-helix domain-containing protein n=1 Tax=Streptomyces sp. NBC_00853 TaxID=2903681 RepID=UPI002F90B6F7|nr:helix-turn-helix domain-containing protein [Streptomyces sp. NBC_00853]WTA24470.1 helix-turn-helix domain-containing protein [Streptomyces sp. NBC_00853]
MSRSVPRPYAALAGHMIRLRRDARLTQEQLGQVAGLSRSTVQRAESGTSTPSCEILRTYVASCGGTEEEQHAAVALRAHGRAAHRGRAAALGAPHPSAMRDRPDLQAVLAADFEKAGATLRDFTRHVPPGGAPIPLGTAWRISRRAALPATAGQLETWMAVCRIHPRTRQIYRDTYARVTADRIPRPGPGRPRRHQEASVSCAEWLDFRARGGWREPKMTASQLTQLIRDYQALAQATRNGIDVKFGNWPKGGLADMSRCRVPGVDAAVQGKYGSLLVIQCKHRS